MKRPVILASLAYAFGLAALLLAMRPAAADAPPAAQAVLAVEDRWLAAIVAGDATTIDAILSKDPEFVHVTADGKVFYRAAELAATQKQTFTMTPSEETVDFVGNVAIIRGINTLASAGKTIARERFTDVFVNSIGTWLAISAQESPIAAP